MIKLNTTHVCEMNMDLKQAAVTNYEISHDMHRETGQWTDIWALMP